MAKRPTIKQRSSYGRGENRRNADYYKGTLPQIKFVQEYGWVQSYVHKPKKKEVK